MFNKIVGLLSFGKNKQSKVVLKKDAIDAKNDAKSKEIFEEYFHRLPGFPQGIPVIPVEFLIQKNDELIKQIILARGMSGAHNKSEVEAKIMAPIRHLAEMTHLLPASEKSHFKLPGGLFTFCLEVSLFSIRYAERRILTRATPEIRKDEESLWAHAAFLNGLFSEAITAISKLSVYAEDVGIEWHPGMESLFEWLQRNNLKHYHLRWSLKEDRSIIYMLAGKAVDSKQAEILVMGEKAILKTLLGALNDQTDFTNPLAKINDTVRYKIMERDEWSYADRYGKPLAGMHLEPWLVDAMRHLVQKKRWVPNEDNGRIWHGQDGVFLVWPLAAGDMQYQLKAAECPFIPSTQEILADIMLDAGIIEKSRRGGYVFDIGVPVAESEERKHVEALKFARYETLFVKTQHKPIDGKLEIEVDEEEDEDSDDGWNINSGTEKNQAALEDTDQALEKVSSAENKTPHEVQESYSEDGDYQESTFDEIKTTESATQSPKANTEEIDIELLFGKPAEPVIERKEEHKCEREEDPELEALFRDEPLSLTANQYDDDYAADYHSGEKSGYEQFESLNQAITNNHLPELALAEKEPVKAMKSESKKVKVLSQKVSTPLPSGDIEIKTDSKKEDKNIDKNKVSFKGKTEQSNPMTVKEDKEKAVNKSVDKEMDSRQINPEKPAKTPSAGIRDTHLNNDDLLGELMGSSKTKEKATDTKTKETKVNAQELEGLFSKSQKAEPGDQSGRAVLILNRLKKLPVEYLEARPGGITKVIGIGLKNTKLELNDCVSVLKASDLLVLIDGYETALDSTGKPKSRYFLVKADLFNGK